ncbi:MAG: hypothetical protein ABIK19_04655, partial [candidate division WOR-3 bacterium]
MAKLFGIIKKAVSVKRDAISILICLFSVCCMLSTNLFARVNFDLNRKYEDWHNNRLRSIVNEKEDFGDNRQFDSLNCRFVGNWPFGPSYTVAYDQTRNLCFLGSGGGVYILNVSNPSNPIKVSEAIHTRSFVNGL